MEIDPNQRYRVVEDRVAEALDDLSSMELMVIALIRREGPMTEQEVVDRGRELLVQFHLNVDAVLEHLRRVN